MATAGRTPEGEMISQVAKAEGGPTKGSTAAQMQSEVDRAKNAQQVDEALQAKMDAGMPVGQREAALAQSREARAPAPAPAPNTTASQAKSQADKEANLEQAAAAIAEKMVREPQNVTSEDAAFLESREHRATGVRPPPDSLAAEAKRIAAANEQGGTQNIPVPPAEAAAAAGGEPLARMDKSNLTREEQAQVDREANFREVAADMAEKVVKEPENVTKEDAGLVHSREERAHGKAAQGGIAAEVHKIADENKKAGNV